MAGCRRSVAPLLWVAVVLAAARAEATTRVAPMSRYAEQLQARRARLKAAGQRPQAVVPLLGLFEELWDRLDDRTPLRPFLEEAVAEARPDVRGRALYLESQLLDRQGDATAAAAVRARLGLVDRFWIVGPFDNEGRSGHVTVYGPEASLLAPVDPTTRFTGKARAVSWRLMPPVAAQGLVSLDSLLRPDTNATAYLTALVHVPRMTRAAVRVGSAGATKVWVNGALALDRDVYRPVHFDQDAAPCWLYEGWNRVTVKLSVLDDDWSLYLRFTAPDGAPLAGLTTSTDAALFAARRSGRAARFTVADAGRELERFAKTRPYDARAWRDVGLYRQYVSPDDPEQRGAATALARAAEISPSPEAYERLGRAETEQNRKLRALERGLDPKLAARSSGAALAPLYEQLGSLYHAARRERRAEALWRRGQKADPTYWPITVDLAQLTAERGLPSRAAAMLARLEEQHPALAVLKAEATLALHRGRRPEAQRLYERVVADEEDDVDTLRQLYALSRAKGAVAQALGFVDRIARARPDLLQTALDRADVLQAEGRREEAHEALQVALRLAPDEAQLLERDGRLLHRLGRDRDALASLRRSLLVRPQNPELRAYLHELLPASHGGDLARAWAVSVPDLLAQRRPAPAGEPARVLLDQQVTRVLPNGLSESYQQRVVEVLDERGARSEDEVDIRYTPDTQSVEVRAARIYKRSGEVVQANSTTDQDVSEPWYGLYYDVKAKVIAFDGLEPGDVLAIEYVISDVGRRNLFADYFGDLHLLQEDLPRVESRYVLIAPKDKKLYFNQPRLPSLKQSRTARGDDIVYTFSAAQVPKIEREPGMPGVTDLAAYVHVSTYRSWQEVADWYRGLVRDQLQSDPQIRGAVRAAVRGLSDERAKIRAVYHLVVQRTRYVGLEFGIHGYKPYRATQVFARKFGDCKDKASLLLVMLREIGVEASLVLARTRQGGDLDPEPASLAPFDHVIVYVPKYDWYLDGTAEFSGADELPAMDQDIPVLLVGVGKLVRTPVLPASRNRVATQQRVLLDPEGGARVEERVSISGEVAHEWREHYQSKGERRERYDAVWGEKHPGAHVEAVTMAVADLERPVSVRAAVRVPGWGRPQGSELVLPVLGREAELQRSYARLSTRRYDLVLGFPWQQEDRTTVVLPRGFKVVRLPEARTVKTPFGHFHLTARARGGTVEVAAALQIDRHRIARGDYPAFRRFCAAVDDALGQELVLGR